MIIKKKGRNCNAVNEQKHVSWQAWVLKIGLDSDFFNLFKLTKKKVSKFAYNCQSRICESPCPRLDCPATRARSR
jgi:hypothetical protein